MRKKIFKKSLRVLILTPIVVFLLIFAIVKINEDRASKNILVNISKRTAAELGAFTAKLFHKGKNSTDIRFGPQDRNKYQESFCDSVEDLNNFLSNKLNAKIEKYYNYDISPYAYNFDYESFQNPQLILLRNKYHLKSLTEGADNEFEKILILRNWVTNRISHGKPKNVDYNFNAIDILERAEKGEKFFCSEHSTVFSQCALSIGLIARYVGLFKGHAVAEVWSNEFEKWIVIDVSNNLHYEKDSIPLNGLELHEIWERGDFKEIEVKVGLEQRTIDKQEENNFLSYYHEFFIRMRNDWFSNKYPHWHPKGNSIMNSLEWQDKYTSNNILISRESSNKEEIYFPLNVVSISIGKQNSTGNQLFLVLETFTPNFSHFVIHIDDNQPIKQKSSDFIWQLHRGRNKLEVWSVNDLGIKGSSSIIKLNI